MAFLRRSAQELNEVFLEVHATPGAKLSRIQKIHGNAIKIQLNSIASQGRANKELLDLISNLFGIKKSEVVIVKGLSSRLKTIKISGISFETANKTLEQCLKLSK